jgi:hypothetical protein
MIGLIDKLEVKMLIQSFYGRLIIISINENLFLLEIFNTTPDFNYLRFV